MHFRYFDPLEQALVEGDLADRAEVAELIGIVSGLRSDCSPAVEFTGMDGTSLVLGVDRDRAVVLWTTADGTTRHSIGGRAADRATCATFDFFGERTQMPGHYAVPLAMALDAAGSLADGARTAPALPLALD